MADNAAKRGPQRKWNKAAYFETKEEALEFVKSEKCWSVGSGNDSKDGYKVTYRCNKVKKGEHCRAGIYLLYHANHETAVSLFRTEDEHDHRHKQSKRGISSKTRREIVQLYEQGVTAPMAILAALQERGLQAPQITQVRNYLQQYKKRGYDSRLENASDSEEFSDDDQVGNALNDEETDQAAYTIAGQWPGRNVPNDQLIYMNAPVAGTSRQQKHCPTCRCFQHSRAL